jgi:hypothetical protein
MPNGNTTRLRPDPIEQVAHTTDFAVRVFFVADIATVPYALVVLKLRRPILFDRYSLIVVRLLRRREEFTEADFAPFGAGLQPSAGAAPFLFAGRGPSPQPRARH